jgi:hypothetical protein
MTDHARQSEPRERRRSALHQWRDLNPGQIIERLARGTLTVPWPSRENLGGLLTFTDAEAWRGFVSELSLHPAIPWIVRGKFRRAQSLDFLARVDFDLIKVGELAALVALELALKDRCGQHLPSKKGRGPDFADLVKYLVEQDGLTDQALPFVGRYGGSLVPHLYESESARLARKAAKVPPPTTLVGIRNSLSHGDPFDGLPWSGLLELVRDLIHYAYRDYLTECGSHTA